MLSPARGVCSRFRAHVTGEKGISTIEWIALGWLALVIVVCVIALLAKWWMGA